MDRSRLAGESSRRVPLLAVLIAVSLFDATALPSASGAVAVPGRWGRQIGREGETEQVRVPDRLLPGLDPPWSPQAQHWFRLDSSSEVGFGVEPAVNRVDGLSILARQTIRSRRRAWGPNVTGYEGYGIASERWSGAIDTWLHPGSRAWSVGARWSDETSPHLLPRQPLDAAEHFIAAGLLREDLLDYLRRRGVSYRLEWSPRPNQGLQAAWMDETHRSLERVVARYGLFGGGKRFPLNPEIDEGEYRGLRLRGRWAREERRMSGPSPMAAVSIDVQRIERTPRGLAPFTRVWLEHRGEARLTPAQGIGYRFAAGMTPRGAAPSDGSRLPRQWQFEAGGIGSLRGTKDGHFQGDRLALATAEYVLHFSPEFQTALFLDSGKAWDQSNDRSGGIAGSGRLALDGGVGVRVGNDGLRIDVARDLRAERASARVTVRLSTPY